MRVFVYYNLHRHVWSLKSMQREFHYGRVIMHADGVLLGDSVFRVSAAGRRRVLAKGQKEVHAGVVGPVRGVLNFSLPAFLEGQAREELERMTSGPWASCPLPEAHAVRATYNPFRWDSFVWFEGEVAHPLHAARSVYMAPRGAVGRDARPLSAPLYITGANASDGMSSASGIAA